MPEFHTHLLQSSFKCLSFYVPAALHAGDSLSTQGQLSGPRVCSRQAENQAVPAPANQGVSAPANQAVSVSAGRNGNTEQIPQIKSPCRAVQHPRAAGEGTGQVTCTGVPQVSGSKAAYPGNLVKG